MNGVVLTELNESFLAIRKRSGNALLENRSSLVAWHLLVIDFFISHCPRGKQSCKYRASGEDFPTPVGRLSLAAGIRHRYGELVLQSRTRITYLKKLVFI